MPKRSPWATQPKKTRRRLAIEHGRQPTEKEIRQWKVLANGVDKALREEKIGFLLSHQDAAAKILGQSLGKGRLQLAEHIRKTRFSDMPDDVVNGLIAQMILEKSTFTGLFKQTQAAMERNATRYFEQRKIPVRTPAERKNLQIALDQQLRDQPFPWPLNLGAIEREYLHHQKEDRGGEIAFRQLRNLIQNMAAKQFFKTSGRRLTPNQRKQLTKWLDRKITTAILDSYGNNQNQPPSKNQESQSQKNKEFVNLIRKIWEQTQTEFLRSFLGPPPKTKTQKKTPAPTAYRKPGTRTQRIRNYQPSNPSEIVPVQDMRLQESIARIGGQKFDLAANILSELETRNASAAKFYRKLLETKRLSPSELASLFTAGPLTVRLFAKATQETDLVEKLGPHAIPKCARLLAYVGNHGRNIRFSEGYFAKRGWSEIYDFLRKRNFFEMHHSGGDVLYLRRDTSEIQ